MVPNFDNFCVLVLCRLIQGLFLKSGLSSDPLQEGIRTTTVANFINDTCVCVCLCTCMCVCTHVFIWVDGCTSIPCCFTVFIVALYKINEYMILTHNGINAV